MSILYTNARIANLCNFRKTRLCMSDCSVYVNGSISVCEYTCGSFHAFMLYNLRKCMKSKQDSKLKSSNLTINNLLDGATKLNGQFWYLRSQ